MKELSSEKVLEIRKLFSAGVSQTTLVKMFHLGPSVVSHIVCNNTYYSADYQPPKKVPIDAEYCSALKQKGFSYSQIQRLEMYHSKRSRPRCIESVRTAILKNNKQKSQCHAS